MSLPFPSFVPHRDSRRALRPNNRTSRAPSTYSTYRGLPWPTKIAPTATPPTGASPPRLREGLAQLKAIKIRLIKFLWKIWGSWRYRDPGVAGGHLSEDPHSAEVSRVTSASSGPGRQTACAVMRTWVVFLFDDRVVRYRPQISKGIF